MMKILSNYNSFKNNISKVLRYLLSKIENNGDSNFERNGEKYFLQSLFFLFKSRNETLTIFDVGANKGEYTEMLLDYSKLLDINTEIHLFEPTKSCYKVLTDKFHHLENVIINNVGVSNSETTASIYYEKEKSGFASLYNRDLDELSIKMDKTEEIQLIRLDDYVIKNNITSIDFMKIDIEGHELTAFEGLGDYLKPDFIDYIQFEYGGANLDSRTYLRDYYNLFLKNNFQIAKIMKKGLHLRNYNPIHENFAYSNFVAISKNQI